GSAESLELLERVDTLVLDKTGTLTAGRPRLTPAAALPPLGAEELVRRAASLERGSEHPLASALVEGARSRGLTLAEVEGFRAFPGRGVSGRVGGRSVALGTEELMRENGVDPGAGGLLDRAAALRRDGQTVIFVSVDGRAAGL